MVEIEFEGEGTVPLLTPLTTVLEAALQEGIPLAHACGGNARCSTCRILVLDGDLGSCPYSEAEADLVKRKGLPATVRLACQLRPGRALKVRRLVRDSVDGHLAEADGGSAGTEQQVAILFCDLRDFTPFVERHLPYDIVHMLNRYFQVAGQAILDQGGYIDKYIGDAIMALFGLDGSDPEAACRAAIAAARGMTAGLGELNDYLQANFGEHFRSGVGIHFGPAVVGAIGHVDHRQLTAIGDSVNVAARIEAKTKELGASILVSSAVRDHLPDVFAGQEPLRTTLKGKSGAFDLFAVLPG